MLWRAYVKDVVVLGSIVLPLTLVALLGVHYEQGRRDSFLEYVALPQNLAGLGAMTLYVLIRPLRKRARTRQEPRDF